MQFTASNYGDIQKYYQGTFVKFAELGDLIVQVKNVDRYCVRGSVEDGRDFVIYLDDSHPYDVSYALPHKSFFQYGYNACMLSRIPAKQYYRGISTTNTLILYKLSTGPADKTGSMPLTFDVLKNFVIKQKYSILSEAIQDTFYTSVALSSRLMYFIPTKTIYMDFFPIARVNINTKNIHLLAPIFEEELRDYLLSIGEGNMFTFSTAKQKEKSLESI